MQGQNLQLLGLHAVLVGGEVVEDPLLPGPGTHIGCQLGLGSRIHLVVGSNYCRKLERFVVYPLDIHKLCFVDFRFHLVGIVVVNKIVAGIVD